MVRKRLHEPDAGNRLDFGLRPGSVDIGNNLRSQPEFHDLWKVSNDHHRQLLARDGFSISNLVKEIDLISPAAEIFKIVTLRACCGPCASGPARRQFLHALSFGFCFILLVLFTKKVRQPRMQRRLIRDDSERLPVKLLRIGEPVLSFSSIGGPKQLLGRKQKRSFTLGL